MPIINNIGESNVNIVQQNPIYQTYLVPNLGNFGNDNAQGIQQ